ncbi:unnamed protein product [Cyclocybe aegerita]|uniref:20S-pre-rRNA D-site endonuclease NOB1 n=1 Tax=Cyclocybe aegerita TaxID=1973307 RepID=A0A8S0VTD9_CYCAE|nr:unnamed protein product [Cyclocybe aegerita]
MASTQDQSRCKRLVLDAGPLLFLSPLRGLADMYLTVPQVLAELRDSRAREHFERLGLISGVKVEVRSPDAASVAHVIQWAKKTGDYTVLSHPDICILALTHALSQEDKKANEEANEKETQTETASNPRFSTSFNEDTASVTVEYLVEGLEHTSLEANGPQQDTKITPQDIPEDQTTHSIEREPLEPLNVELTPVKNEGPSRGPTSARRPSPTPIYNDPSDEDDGEGEWITPSNVGIHKSRALDLLPEDGSGRRGKKKAQPVDSGCMTADFAMQNVLLQMGLNLVGLEGKRIEKIKSWVLRCHACFKICKDNSKKFCPSCGNATLLRASVTVAAPNADPNAPAMQVHLKPNFQYKIRGTKYSIPAPKPGSAKTGPGTGLVLREDQIEYIRAKKRADGKREREEERLSKGILNIGLDSRGETAGVSSWMDPDWIPEIISVGSGGKGRTMRDSRMDGDMPQIGYGRKNPNEKRRKK